MVYRILSTAFCLLCTGAFCGSQTVWSEKPEFEWVDKLDTNFGRQQFGWVDNDRVAFIGVEDEGKSKNGTQLKVWDTRTRKVTNHETDVAMLCANGVSFGYFRLPVKMVKDWPVLYRKPFWVLGGWYRGEFPNARRATLPPGLEEKAKCAIEENCPEGMTRRGAFQSVQDFLTNPNSCSIRPFNRNEHWKILLRDEDGELLTGALPREEPAATQNLWFRKAGVKEAVELPISAGQVYLFNYYYPFKGAYFLYKYQSKEEQAEGVFWPAWWLWPDGRTERIEVPRGLAGWVFPTRVGLLHSHSPDDGSEGGFFLFLPKGPVRVSRIQESGWVPAVSPNGCKFMYQINENRYEGFQYEEPSKNGLYVLDLCAHQDAIEQLPVHRFKNLLGPTYRVPLEKN
jgi:hypothetical protein